MAKDFDIKVKGLAELRKDLRRQQPETLKELQRALKGGSEIAAAAARAIAPQRTGALAASYRAFTRGNVSGVRSRLPYAGVIEYGGEIRPKGTPIRISAHGTLTRAIADNEDRIVEAVADGIEAAARRTGWK